MSSYTTEVRSIVHGYFQSQFRVPVYEVVGRPTQDSIKREEALTTVTNAFMAKYTIPTDTNELPKLPSRDDVETWWISNEQTMNLRSEHGWTIDGPASSAQIFVGTHVSPSAIMTVVCQIVTRLTKHLKTTSWFITAWKDLIWTRTTPRTTLKKMSSEGWKRQSRRLGISKLGVTP